MQIRKDVDMVFCTVDAKQNTISFFYDSPDIPVEVVVLLGRQCVPAPVSAKDYVVEYLTITVHKLFFVVDTPHHPQLKLGVMQRQLLSPPVETGG